MFQASSARDEIRQNAGLKDLSGGNRLPLRVVRSAVGMGSARSLERTGLDTAIVGTRSDGAVGEAFVVPPREQKARIEKGVDVSEYFGTLSIDIAEKLHLYSWVKLFKLHLDRGAVAVFGENGQHSDEPCSDCRIQRTDVAMRPPKC
jgi:hypothetical protein